jgi:nucleoid DNA-binding protein
LITKTELVTGILDVLEELDEDAGYTKKDVNTFLSALTVAVYDVVGQAEVVTIPGLARIGCRIRPAGKFRNPATGETVKKGPAVITFARAVKPLKDASPTLAVAKAAQAERDAEKAAKARARSRVKPKVPAKATRGRPRKTK